jgi:CHAT domain-containing protein
VATSPRCVCLVLTLWMAVLRPSAAVRSGSPDSIWWGTRESAQLQDSIRKLLRAGNYAAGEALFQKCLAEIVGRHDFVAEARCQSGIAGTRMARLNYQGSLSAYMAAKAAAVAGGDQLDLAAIDFNLSSLYQQIFDFGSALRAADEGLSAATKVPNPYYKAQLLMQLGRLHSGKGGQDTEQLYLEGIEAARAAGGHQNFEAVEATGWDLLGDERLSHDDEAGAERAQLQAFLLRRLFNPRDLGYSYARLGALRLAQGEASPPGARKAALLQEAGRFTERAMLDQARGALTLPAYQLVYQRGSIRLAQGNPRSALEDLEAAVRLAERWRAGIPRTLSSLDAATEKLEQQVVDRFIETAATFGTKTQSLRWLTESFQAAELNRSPSLKDHQALADVWRRKLPVEFWEILSKLRSEDVRLLRARLRKSSASDGLRLRLGEMEAKAGLGVSLNHTENFPSGESLTLFQTRLRPSEAFLSFWLGEKNSVLWVSTRNTSNVYLVAGRKQIRQEVQDFRNAIAGGRPELEAQSEQLYRTLFGQLRQVEKGRPDWLLSLDDVLFDLPFAALIPDLQVYPKRSRRAGQREEQQRSHEIVYLAEKHSLEATSGILPLRKDPVKPALEDGRFVAVGDPVYNVADPRWAGPRWVSPRWVNQSLRLARWFGLGSTNDLTGQLNRLPGTGAEVEASARAWTAVDGTAAQTSLRTIVLKGPAAGRDRFLQELSPPPAVIHLATHILTASQDHERAFLAFSLSPAAQSELLETSEVAMLHVPGALVVMTGCSSAAGVPVAGAGLDGLTRAWSIAGARAVVATQWPVKDNAGQFFASFYRHLRESTVADALRLSQVEMLHSGTALANPAAWASYQVVRGIQ